MCDNNDLCVCIYKLLKTTCGEQSVMGRVIISCNYCRNRKVYIYIRSCHCDRGLYSMLSRVSHENYREQSFIIGVARRGYIYSTPQELPKTFTLAHFARVPRFRTSCTRTNLTCMRDKCYWELRSRSFRRALDIESTAHIAAAWVSRRELH